MFLRSPAFRRSAILVTRFGLAAAYLSAVVDRFGVWGRPGTPNVTWGDFQHFTTQVSMFLPWFPKSAVPVLAWLATVLEAALGLGLLLGVRTKIMAAASACLLLLYGLSMTFSAGGIHSALASSVFSAAGASLLLAYVSSGS